MFDVMFVNAETVLNTVWQDVQSELSEGEPVFPPGDPELRLVDFVGYSKTAIATKKPKTYTSVFILFKVPVIFI